MVNECPHGYPLEELHRCAFCKRHIPETATITKTLGPAEWERQAKRLIWDMARSGNRFTTEDITDRIGFPDTTHRPNGRNNRIGTLISSMAKNYRLTIVDEAKARNAQSNGRTIKVWIGKEYL